MFQNVHGFSWAQCSVGVRVYFVIWMVVFKKTGLFVWQKGWNSYLWIPNWRNFCKINVLLNWPLQPRTDNSHTKNGGRDKIELICCQLLPSYVVLMFLNTHIAISATTLGWGCCIQIWPKVISQIGFYHTEKSQPWRLRYFKISRFVTCLKSTHSFSKEPALISEHHSYLHINIKYICKIFMKTFSSYFILLY